MKRKSSGKKEVAEKKIAVIEEIADNIYSIKFILQSIGYNVDCFSSRESHEASLREFSPQLIIIDMMIPDGEAYRIIGKLRKSSLKKVPILAITAEAMEGKEEDVYKAGGQDHLSKPYTVTDLRKKLKKWLK
ncbi:response regulator [Acidobacteria bacterium AH-259-D05]|nr:response regulator [Acidobacteria bacterium AH-259-D05]